jgi:hypothetical protein
MSYDEVEIEDMKWDEQLQAYTYSCPCGDVFQITLVSNMSSAHLCSFCTSAADSAALAVMNEHSIALLLQALCVQRSGHSIDLLTCLLLWCPAGATPGWGGDRSLPQLLFVHHCRL